MTQYMILVCTNELTDLPVLFEDLHVVFTKQNAQAAIYELGTVNLGQRQDPSIG